MIWTWTTLTSESSPMTRLLRIVRLDDSDTQVYEPCAEAGEWAVPGSFYFWDLRAEDLGGKRRQAFSHGFLGIGSFGWGTVVAVAEISQAELEQATQELAFHLVQRFGAPDMAAALPAAREEIEFAIGLCEHPPNTLITVQREFQGEEIQENFRRIQPSSGADHESLRLFGVDNSYDANG